MHNFYVATSPSSLIFLLMTTDLKLVSIVKLLR